MNDILAAERAADLRRAADRHHRAVTARPARARRAVGRRLRRTRPAGATT
jgi:hypothetical protein